jgi:hypothetical protein
MELLVIENGRRRYVPTRRLLPGKQGNLQSLAVLIPMVRRDAVEDLEVRKLALSLIADCPNEFECQAGKLFEYARSIDFVRDPVGAERIADAATTIAEQAGDCDDKTTLLTTMLGSIGYVSRLVALCYEDDLEENGYDHLLSEVQRDDGTWVPLDATPEEAPMGWEPEALIRNVFEIWPEAATKDAGVGGDYDGLIATGVRLGTQYAAGRVQQARQSAAQEKQLGAAFDSKAGQVTQLFNQIQALPVMTREAAVAAIAAFEELAQIAAQYPDGYIGEQWASTNYKPAYEARLQQIVSRVEVEEQSANSNQQTGVVEQVTSLLESPWALGGLVLVFGWVVLRSRQ